MARSASLRGPAVGVSLTPVHPVARLDALGGAGEIPGVMDAQMAIVAAAAAAPLVTATASATASATALTATASTADGGNARLESLRAAPIVGELAEVLGGLVLADTELGYGVDGAPDAVGLHQVVSLLRERDKIHGLVCGGR